QAVLPADTTLTNGTGSVSVALATAGVQSISAADKVTASSNGTQTSVTLNAAAAERLRVNGPASGMAGSALTFAVTALDAFNNTAGGYLGTVHFTSSDAQATLPADYT